MYDQTSSGQEPELDVGTSYDPTSRSTGTSASASATGTGYPEPDYRSPGYSGTAYPQQEYTSTGYTEPGYTEPGYTEAGYTEAGATTTRATTQIDQTGQTGAGAGGTGMADKAKNVAKTGAQATSTAAKETAQTVAQEARGVAEEISTQARGAATDLGKQLKEQAHQQHGTMVTRLREASDEMRQMTEGREQTPTTSLVSNFATHTNRLADHLETRGLEGVLDEVQEFARRRPGTFLLAAAAAGFMVGRLGKGILAASGEESGQARDYQTAYRAGTADTTARLNTGTTSGTTGTTAAHETEHSSTEYATGRASLIHDEGGWTDLRAPVTHAATAPAPSTLPPTGTPPSTTEGGRL